MTPPISTIRAQINQKAPRYLAGEQPAGNPTSRSRPWGFLGWRRVGLSSRKASLLEARTQRWHRFWQNQEQDSPFWLNLKMNLLRLADATTQNNGVISRAGKILATARRYRLPSQAGQIIEIIIPSAQITTLGGSPVLGTQLFSVPLQTTQTNISSTLIPTIAQGKPTNLVLHILWHPDQQPYGKILRAATTQGDVSPQTLTIGLSTTAIVDQKDQAMVSPKANVSILAEHPIASTSFNPNQASKLARFLDLLLSGKKQKPLRKPHPHRHNKTEAKIQRAVKRLQPLLAAVQPKTALKIDVATNSSGRPQSLPFPIPKDDNHQINPFTGQQVSQQVLSKKSGEWYVETKLSNGHTEHKRPLNLNNPNDAFELNYRLKQAGLLK